MLKAKEHIWYVQQIKMFTPDEITIAKASTLPLASKKEEDSKDIRRCLSGPLIGQVESMWTK